MQTSRDKDNTHEFLETPHSNRKRLKEKEKLSEDIKSKYIQQLEERNRKLKYQIIKINEMLEEQKGKGKEKKEYKLIPNESSADVLKKQLENVYKQIKNYEREISNLQTKQSGGLITDKMSRLENILNEKVVHLDKLKAELTALTKNSLQNSKKLKNNAGKEELENMMLKYNDEIKMIREKVRQAEDREKKKMQNAKKQFDYIKKLQRELIENGVSIDELEQIKKNNIYNQIYDKLHNSDQDKDNKQPSKAIPKEEIQDLTIDRYHQLQNQAKLYKKLHLDYDKRLENLQKQHETEQKNAQTSKLKLEEKEQEIKKLQDQIGELKTKMRKNNIKAGGFTSSKDDQKDKSKEKPKLPPKLRSGLNQKTLTDQTHLKYDQKGVATEKGQKFTDRAAIGKATNSRIICVKVWTEKSSFAICGMQCIYKVGDQVKSGRENVGREAKRNCTENLMELADGDFIKNVSGHLSQNNIVEYLVLISSNSVIGRFGVAKPTQKQFNFDIDEDEIPICLYGSLLTTHENKMEVSYLEQLGLEISRDKNFAKDDKFP